MSSSISWSGRLILVLAGALMVLVGVGVRSHELDYEDKVDRWKETADGTEALYQFPDDEMGRVTRSPNSTNRRQRRRDRRVCRLGRTPMTKPKDPPHPQWPYLLACAIASICFHGSKRRRRV